MMQLKMITTAVRSFYLWAKQTI